MNIYPIFDLPVKYYSDTNESDYSFSLITEQEIARGEYSLYDLAMCGDILIGTSRKRFWTRTEESWDEHDFSELPEEYKAWVALLG